MFVGECFPPFSVCIVCVCNNYEDIGVNAFYSRCDSLYLSHPHHHHQRHLTLLGVQSLAVQYRCCTVKVIYDKVAQDIVVFIYNFRGVS